jgi:hypothetical protein
MFYDIKGVIRNRKSKTGNTTPCSKEKKRQKEKQEENTGGKNKMR